jgi:peptidoglycan-N-acetylglucosamine deacetylase
MISGGMRKAGAAGGGLLISIDVEDHTAPPNRPRFEEALAPLLSMLQASGAKATFFVVGELAHEWRGQLRQLVAAGHEVGLHGNTHRFIESLGERGFADDVASGVAAISEAVGLPPVGYRAPYFSLTPATPWAPGILQDAGFRYSSSVLPAWNPQACFQAAPRQPFRWDCGLIELPSPVFGLGKFSIPVLGGAYVRLVPGFVVRLAAKGCAAADGHWTYSHPYDFDTSEPFFRRPGQSWVVARLLFAHRGRMLTRVAGLMTPSAVTLGEFALSLNTDDSLPVFSPR